MGYNYSVYFELFSNFKLSKYFNPTQVCKYTAQTVYFLSILSPFFVLSNVKLKDTNKKKFCNVSMDEQLEWSELYHTSTVFPSKEEWLHIRVKLYFHHKVSKMPITVHSRILMIANCFFVIIREAHPFFGFLKLGNVNE